MLLTLLVLLPILSLADEACDIATKLDNDLRNADTVDKVLALYTHPFITNSCSKKQLVLLDDAFRNKTEIHLEVKKDAGFLEATKERNMTSCKIVAETNVLEYSVYYPVQNITAGYHARLVGEDYKIDWEHLCL